MLSVELCPPQNLYIQVLISPTSEFGLTWKYVIADRISLGEAILEKGGLLMHTCDAPMKRGNLNTDSNTMSHHVKIGFMLLQAKELPEARREAWI